MEVGGQIWAPGAQPPSPPRPAIIRTTTQPLQLMGMYLCSGTRTVNLHKSKLTQKMCSKYIFLGVERIIYMNWSSISYLNKIWAEQVPLGIPWYVLYLKSLAIYSSLLTESHTVLYSVVELLDGVLGVGWSLVVPDLQTLIHSFHTTDTG